jgi:hypothetical protein
MQLHDVDALIALFQELQTFHRLPIQTRSQLHVDLTQKIDSFEVTVAEIDGRVVGFARASLYPGARNFQGALS